MVNERCPIELRHVVFRNGRAMGFYVPYRTRGPIVRMYVDASREFLHCINKHGDHDIYLWEEIAKATLKEGDDAGE